MSAKTTHTRNACSIPVGRMARAEDVANFVEFVARYFITDEEILMNSGSSN
jgi:hypothetical protein